MQIISLQPKHIEAAAELFAAQYRRLRRAAPILPERMQDPAPTAARLAELLARSAGLAAVEDGRLAGYMAWWVIDNFRETSRRAAYVPVWAHASAQGVERAATAALHHAACTAWHRAGCRAFAATLLTDDPLIYSFWFWNNYGALVVDAVRPAAPLSLPAKPGVSVRMAAPADAALMAALEAEHWRHYSQPPVLMMASHPAGVEECAALIADPANRVWLAFDGMEPVGYIRCEGSSEGAAEVMEDAPGRTTAITGAYVRPQFRGRGAAPAMIDAAAREFAARGGVRMAVDFESFNPEASTLWMKYFTPACISVIRYPEKSPEHPERPPGMP